MRVLVTGCKGILGQAVLAALTERKVPAQGVDVAEMDIASPARVRAVIGRYRPTVVINCAAFTRVDDCEKNRALCYDINAHGAGNVAAACAAVGARIVHISTDYVFDGQKDAPYREDDLPAPLSVYGEGKLEGEWRVAAATPDHLVVRTAWLFGKGGVNFISKILTRAKAGEALEVVNDQYGSPTYARHVADALCELIAVGARGLVHVAGAGVATWFDVAAEVLRLTGLRVPLSPVGIASLGMAAPRPRYSALDTNRYTTLTGRRMPPLQDGVAAYLRELKELKAGAD